MESLESQFQRRAMVGERHFILADPSRVDVWALPGPVVISVDDNGLRSFGAARTISTQGLRDLAMAKGLPFRIEERYPVVRRDLSELLVA